VADEGEGVAAEMRQRVFTKFWRSGRRGGTGLGLYIVRGLVEAHGGRIEISDAPGGGALFAIELPSGAPDFEL
jgi:signal transduction histidine kinase